jgi:beta-galactosidase GanA
VIARSLSICTVAAFAALSVRAADTPHLALHGSATQLIVDGRPYLVLGGELSNSSASDPNYLSALWPGLEAVGLNTVFAPVEWDQLEPHQGHFDFSVTDALVKQARQHHMHIVVLWFGAWKNSMSTYVPPWVKRNYALYARARDDKGQAQDILSPFAVDTLHADSAAFAALLSHLKRWDVDRTVIAVQVENEIGMLPVVRDYSDLAQAAYDGSVPAEFLTYLETHRDALNPYVRDLWAAQGFKTKGTWAEVFGISIPAQEVFQAWYFAIFANSLARAGKAAYPLPMYVNVALNRPGRRPGEYPSAGPLPHLFDVWKAAGPDLDMIAMDMYFPNFVEWANKFKRPDNAFFSPEDNQAGRPDAGANALYAIGELDSMSFSPFAIDTLKPDSRVTLARAYEVLGQLTPRILAAQGTGKMRGFRSDVSYEGTASDRPSNFELGGYRFTVNYDDNNAANPKEGVANNGGLIIQIGDDEFLVAGQGVTLTFQDADQRHLAVGIQQDIEGSFVGEEWKPGRWLNGDDTLEGRQVHLPSDTFSIQKVTLFKFR